LHSESSESVLDEGVSLATWINAYQVGFEQHLIMDKLFRTSNIPYKKGFLETFDEVGCSHVSLGAFYAMAEMKMYLHLPKPSIR